jgi:anthranilate synthase component 1
MFDILDNVKPRNLVSSLVLDCKYQSNPLALYHHLCEFRSDTLLLESADVDSKDHLKSIVLVDAALKIQCRDSDVSFLALTENGLNLLVLLKGYFSNYITETFTDKIILDLRLKTHNNDEDAKLLLASPLDALRYFLTQITMEYDSDPAVLLCGVIAFDLIASYEVLPTVSDGFNDCPDFVYYVAQTHIVVDHQQQSTSIISHIFPGSNKDVVWGEINAHAKEVKEYCLQEVPYNATSKPSNEEVTESIDDDQFIQVVDKLKSNIKNGDIFQTVFSREFFIRCDNPFGAYESLRENNPSPYMFYLNTGDFVLFGASPESALKYDAETRYVEIYPIAGTRPRGKHRCGELNHDLDSRIEFELRQDEKELCEHMMLVDLARNDVARISEPGTRQVKELLKVDRYSHVMHLVSRVTGTLMKTLDSLHAYQACMNMGTLTGAPKIIATELIRRIEGQRRGSYG